MTLRRDLFTGIDTFWFATGAAAAVVPVDAQQVDVMWQIYGRQATAVRFCSYQDGHPDCRIDLLHAERLLRFVDPHFLGRNQRRHDHALLDVHMPATPWAGVWATDSGNNIYHCSAQQEPHCDRVGGDDDPLLGWPVGVRSLLRPRPIDVLWVETEDHSIVRCTVDATHATPICQRSRLLEN
ncbi:MAG: hypothetical protein GXP55_23170 [Deltaproteobacteria bacterium]|nr:hypothetical protein [Deltaproteobacteria bacterium]